ncbi:unnamed protein product [Mycena citricolor]|uniref:FMN hydroxy acid dehydrogenase domain-containing protein n=1 Tax=Mycena citricolor TaxID=2018698 RepID=A0AAD2HYA6_9AGAR|nr:unnamed protein product [Mycena citricolor]
MSDKQPWATFTSSLYLHGKGPQALGTVSFEEIEQKAKEALKDYPGNCNLQARDSIVTHDYACRSIYVRRRQRRNRLDLCRQSTRFREVPHRTPYVGRCHDAYSRGVSRVDSPSAHLSQGPQTTIFGVTHPSPIIIAPIGVQGTFIADGELASARAAAKLKIPFVMSTASTRPIETVAAANGDGHRWYQLYWPATKEVTLSLLSRAKAGGFTALVVTLDTMTLGWRPHDLETAYIPFVYGVGNQVGTSDPVFMRRFGREPVTGPPPKFPFDQNAMRERLEAQDAEAMDQVFLGTEWLKECNSGLFRSWEDLRFLRENWEGPLIIKGIQRVEDAEKSLEYGVNGIVVSNHGGRQVDGALPSLYALERIMKSQKVKEAQTSGALTVLFDSGIRTGSDIIKALALGAQAVLLGRPWLYGGIVAGQAGIEQVILHTLADLDATLGLSGYASLADIQGKGEEIVEKIDF